MQGLSSRLEVSDEGVMSFGNLMLEELGSGERAASAHETRGGPVPSMGGAHARERPWGPRKLLHAWRKVFTDPRPEADVFREELCCEAPWMRASR